MKARIERARFLARELQFLARDLARNTHDSSVALFLEHLLRLRCFTASELRQADVLRWVELAEATWAEAAQVLIPHLGRALNPEALWDLLLDLEAGEADVDHDIQGWLADFLLLATVAPWMPGKSGQRAQERVEDCLAVLESAPHTFMGIHQPLQEREELEGLNGLPPWTRQIWARLRRLPLLLALDASEARAPEGTVENLLGALGIAVSPPGASSVIPLDSIVLERARRALQERDSWGPPTRETDALLRMAAADDGDFWWPLGSRLGESWYLAGGPGAWSLRGPHDPDISVEPPDRPGTPLQSWQDDDGRAWDLSALPLEGQRLRLALSRPPQRAILSFSFPSAPHPLQKRLARWTLWRPFAPLTMASLAIDEARTDKRLSPRDGRRLLHWAREAKQMAAQPRPPFACPFPVSISPHPRVPDQLRGAVLRIGLAETEWTDGGEPFRDIAGAEDPTFRLLEREQLASLSLNPKPGYLAPTRPVLEGGSWGAACALVLEAKRRGRAIPPDLVVSAALVSGPDGPWLAPVGRLQDKCHTLEREMPGCRFFFVAPPEQEPPTSRGITTVPLRPGPPTQLFERVWGKEPAIPSTDPLPGLIRDAFHAYRQQDYELAEQLYDTVIETTDAQRASSPESDRYALEARLRLGVISMHRGRPTEAAQALSDLLDTALGTVSLSLRIELKSNLAAAFLDAFQPAETRSTLEAERRVLAPFLALDPRDTPSDIRDALVTWLGTWRRLHLLQAHPRQALAVQRSLLRLLPPREMARGLGALGECARRASQPEQAVQAWNDAIRALSAAPRRYRANTEAFIRFYGARAALVQPAMYEAWALTPEECRSLMQRTDLPAARWRLELMELLLSLEEGDPSPLRAWFEGLRARSDFLAWHQALGLLLVECIEPSLAPLALRMASQVMARVDLRGAPELRSARDALVTATREGSHPGKAVRELLRYCAY